MIRFVTSLCSKRQEQEHTLDIIIDLYCSLVYVLEITAGTTKTDLMHFFYSLFKTNYDWIGKKNIQVDHFLQFLHSIVESFTFTKVLTAMIAMSGWLLA